MISVVVLAYGEEPYLQECIEAVLAAPGRDIELILVDNGSPAVASVRGDDRLRIVRPGSNLGFSGGCNLGVGQARGDVIVLVNSDAVVRPGALEALAGAVTDPAVGLASGSVRLADRPDVVNSAGNPVHFLGLVWAGGYGEPASRFAEARDVPTASGAFLAVRRTVWEQLGGFPAEYFAYHEDSELSLRAWLAGYRVRYEPAAVALHHYEFSRNPSKQYLLERNRWLTVLTVYPRRVLWAVAPALVLFDVALLAVAALQGWVGAKVRGWLWLLRHVPAIRRRRRVVQQRSVLSDTRFAALLAGRIDAAVLGRPPGLGLLNAVLAAYWRSARAVISDRPGRKFDGRS